MLPHLLSLPDRPAEIRTLVLFPHGRGESGTPELIDRQATARRGRA